jgi:peptidoglycan/LPS O-acetylase OafA/YrhL
MALDDGETVNDVAGEAWRLGRRPGLDGVRGFAVLLVLALHWWPATFPGGYLGVDLFFVLSGFLITRLLIEEAERTGRVDLRRFYLRRAARLMPALAVLLLVCAAVPSVWMVAAYGANWARIDGHLIGGPLEHTWSLAIEEQFYLLWPVCFLAVKRLQRPVLLLGGLVVLVMFHRVGTTDADWAVNGFDTRADGLLVGCAVAFTIPVLARWGGWTRLAVASVAALVGMTVAGFEAHRYGYTLVALLCVPLVLGGLTHPTFGVLRWMGRLSYSLYLWHYPVTWWLRGGDIRNTSAATTASAIAVSAVVAVVSWRFVEQPLQGAVHRRTDLERSVRSGDEGSVDGSLSGVPEPQGHGSAADVARHEGPADRRSDHDLGAADAPPRLDSLVP